MCHLNKNSVLVTWHRFIAFWVYWCVNIVGAVYEASNSLSMAAVNKFMDDSVVRVRFSKFQSLIVREKNEYLKHLVLEECSARVWQSLW